MTYTKAPASGLKNIKVTPEGSYAVFVSSNYLGTFKDRDKAIKVRDEYRAKNNMSKVEN